MFLGTVCTVPVLRLFLTEMDGVCVFVLELCMRDEHREKKPQGLFSQEAFCYSGLTQCGFGVQVPTCGTAGTESGSSFSIAGRIVVSRALR